MRFSFSLFMALLVGSLSLQAGATAMTEQDAKTQLADIVKLLSVDDLSAIDAEALRTYSLITSVEDERARRVFTVHLDTTIVIEDSVVFALMKPLEIIDLDVPHPPHYRPGHAPDKIPFKVNYVYRVKGHLLFFKFEGPDAFAPKEQKKKDERLTAITIRNE